MKVNGWGLTGPRSSRLHAVPTPTDLGDHGRAVCGKRPSTRTGWTEPEQYDRRPARCRRCVAKTEAGAA